ncbi:hypothetical protein [Nucisporomicrobium flavum]|uniref:hypothetical protein n=1 Tax=Nucisporomicrobium flavum TaxID=2785915 RepID=UPI0018F4F918|nr:hypothetical protein [Nucisporomicrobium flavum]
MTYPPHTWLALALGAGPHVAVVAVGAAAGEWPFLTLEGAVCAIPFALYGRAELIIVPVSLILVIVAGAFHRVRPWRLWFFIGTLVGAVLVLMIAAVQAGQVVSI